MLAVADDGKNRQLPETVQTPVAGEQHADHIAYWRALQGARIVADHTALPPPSLDDLARSGNIERIVSWALSRTGRLPWRNAADWELSLDQGLTVRPRRKPHGHWYLIEAGAHTMMLRDRLPGAGTLHKVPGNDAATVIEAIKALPPNASSMILRHGRVGTRPDFIADDRPPQPVLRTDGQIRIVEFQGPKRHRRRVPAFCPIIWSVDPETICASHRLYEAWHAGMTRLVNMLCGELSICSDIWFSAPAHPWEKAENKAA